MMNITARAMSSLDWVIREAAKSLATMDPDSEDRKNLGYKLKCAREALNEVKDLRKEIAQGAKA